MKILIIQTAFLGDVVLATPLIEKLKEKFPDGTIDFMVRKGNESLLDGHPKIRQVLVFDKKKNKFRNLFHLIRQARREAYDYVINVQRFFSSGLIAVLSGAKQVVGFDKNPLSFAYSRRIPHDISLERPTHEVARNLLLIRDIAGEGFVRPKLYCRESDVQVVPRDEAYVCVAPASIWFTKQYLPEKWVALIRALPAKYKVYLLGAPSDISLCEEIQRQTDPERVVISAGKLSLLQSAALMSGAAMTFTNDSAPMHLASAVNAPVCAVFCSTVPAFGFGPLSDVSFVIETDAELPCRPCGLHGYKACPEGHFRCADIDTQRILRAVLPVLQG